jgi:2-polyprenyl-3-methyl-5-hydroxy-6-metoxy-1,4-benzoquinol methylase
MSSYTRHQLEQWISTKSVSGRVLDIGGSQLPIKDRINHTPETSISILDLHEPHEAKAKPEITWDLNFPLPSAQFHRTFDFAVCLEVSEYWFDPMTALTNIANMLKQGGTLFISFHFVYPVHKPINQDYLRYTRMGAMKLLERTGFEIKEIMPRSSHDPDLLREFIQGEGMRPAQGWDFHDEVGVLVEAVKK